MMDNNIIISRAYSVASDAEADGTWTLTQANGFIAQVKRDPQRWAGLVEYYEGLQRMRNDARSQRENMPT